MTTKIAVVVPALDEEATIGQVVSGCRSILERDFELRVFVVDDGSSDRTAELAHQAGATVVSHATNRGVGSAFQTGLTAALRCRADIVVSIDADGQFEPEAIPDLIAPILDDRADFVTASRFMDPSMTPVMPRVKLWGNRMMSRIVSRIANRKFHDVSCGFRAYNREAALNLNLWGAFTYTHEVILDLMAKGLRLQEVPMRIRGVREVGESRVASNLWRYGLKTMTIILQSYRDYWPFRFFGLLSLPFLVSGLGFILFILVHRFTSGRFSPHIWAGFTGGSLFFVGLIVLLAGVAGETLKRIRLTLENILYYQKSSFYDKG